MRQQAIGTISGKQFIRIVQSEMQSRNTGLSRLTAETLANQSGVHGHLVRSICDGKTTASKNIPMRALLWTLGFEIACPEDDVIPHLKGKGCFDPVLHGLDVERRSIAAALKKAGQ